jgi:hypothetical protein
MVIGGIFLGQQLGAALAAYGKRSNYLNVADMRSFK